MKRRLSLERPDVDGAPQPGLALRQQMHDRAAAQSHGRDDSQLRLIRTAFGQLASVIRRLASCHQELVAVVEHIASGMMVDEAALLVDGNSAIPSADHDTGGSESMSPSSEAGVRLVPPHLSDEPDMPAGSSGKLKSQDLHNADGKWKAALEVLFASVGGHAKYFAFKRNELQIPAGKSPADIAEEVLTHMRQDPTLRWEIALQPFEDKAHEVRNVMERQLREKWRNIMKAKDPSKRCGANIVVESPAQDSVPVQQTKPPAIRPELEDKKLRSKYSIGTFTVNTIDQLQLQGLRLLDVETVERSLGMTQNKSQKMSKVAHFNILLRNDTEDICKKMRVAPQTESLRVARLFCVDKDTSFAAVLGQYAMFTLTFPALQGRLVQCAPVLLFLVHCSMWQSAERVSEHSHVVQLLEKTVRQSDDGCAYSVSDVGKHRNLLQNDLQRMVGAYVLGKHSASSAQSQFAAAFALLVCALAMMQDDTESLLLLSSSVKDEVFTAAQRLLRTDDAEDKIGLVLGLVAFGGFTSKDPTKLTMQFDRFGHKFSNLEIRLLQAARVLGEVVGFGARVPELCMLQPWLSSECENDGLRQAAHKLLHKIQSMKNE